jgi:6-phosphofructokinase 1
MGHRAGWLTLGAGIAGGADVILIPEIPYDVEEIARAIRRRSQRGMNFSIVAVAEGAMSRRDAARFKAIQARKSKAKNLVEVLHVKAEVAEWEHRHAGNTLRLAHQLEQLTGLESRLSILGYVQRGGAPSAVDRLLATRLGTACVELIAERRFGVMVAARGDGTRPVPIADVAGRRKGVPLDHPWIASARAVGTCFGD